MFALVYQYYYLVLILQAFCVFHCMRKGNSQQWIWLIVFLPAIGCIVYLFSEVITKSDVRSVTNNVDAVIRPKGRIKDLEEAFSYSDSFENRLLLASAYLNAGRTDETIELCEQGKKGIFVNDPHLIIILIEAYYAKERYADVCKIGADVINNTDFRKSHSRILMALSLEKLGEINQAEEHLSSFQARYSDFEGKYEYACFLLRQNREPEALKILKDIKEESSRMSRGERRNHEYWIRQSLEKFREMNKAEVVS